MNLSDALRDGIAYLIGEPNPGASPLSYLIALAVVFLWLALFGGIGALIARRITRRLSKPDDEEPEAAEPEKPTVTGEDGSAPTSAPTTVPDDPEAPTDSRAE